MALESIGAWRRRESEFSLRAKKGRLFRCGSTWRGPEPVTVCVHHLAWAGSQTKNRRATAFQWLHCLALGPRASRSRLRPSSAARALASPSPIGFSSGFDTWPWGCPVTVSQGRNKSAESARLGLSLLPWQKMPKVAVNHVALASCLVFVSCCRCQSRRLGVLHRHPEARK